MDVGDASEAYESLRQVGEGTFGVVHVARRVCSGELVALKKVRLRRLEDGKEGLPNAAFREMKALQELRSDHVVGLLDTFPQGTSLVLVLEYMPTDLSKVLDSLRGAPLSEAEVKGYARQMLAGLAACHAVGIMHRDIKPSNLLVSADGVVKIGDFGLARARQPEAEARCRAELAAAAEEEAAAAAAAAAASDGQGMDTGGGGGGFFGAGGMGGYGGYGGGPGSTAAKGALYTHTVATRWYRAPELLYGARLYDYGVDLWAAGCVVGEMLNHGPIFPGESDIDQLFRVFHVVGTPDPVTWPGVKSLPDYGKLCFEKQEAQPWSRVLPGCSRFAQEAVGRMLSPNPDHRPSAEDALVDPFFFAPPLPCPPEHLRTGVEALPRVTTTTGRGSDSVPGYSRLENALPTDMGKGRASTNCVVPFHPVSDLFQPFGF
jgi:cell cycle related kinase